MEERDVFLIFIRHIALMVFIPTQSSEVQSSIEGEATIPRMRFDRGSVCGCENRYGHRCGNGIYGICVAPRDES